MMNVQRGAISPASGMHDVTVVGAGIVGLATALAFLERFPRLRVLVVDKEPRVGAHQTGHNSGVIHSGIYYRPGSLKARLCRAGAERMLRFCELQGIRTICCGKLIVATEERELPMLDQLFERGLANGVPGLEQVGPARIRDLEPRAAGLAALHLPHVAIVDYGDVARAMARAVGAGGGEIVLGARVLGIREGHGGLYVQTTAGDLATRYLVNCAGLHSDTVARLAGMSPRVRIIPFRGEYHTLAPGVRDWVRGLIYPAPDPRFPFLGVHLTRTVHGAVEAGPNAVLALAREGYTRYRLSPASLSDMLAFPGFWRMARRYWRTGLGEWYRSCRKVAFARSLQRLVPDLAAGHLTAGGAGVRAQAVARDGRLVDDFLFLDTPRAVHVLNAPSPAATASLAIGEAIVERLAGRWELGPFAGKTSREGE